MANLKLTFNVKEIAEKAGKSLKNLENLDNDALLEDIGEGLLISTEVRFERQSDPEGKPWAALSPRTRARKRNSRILTETAHLRGRNVKQIDGGELHIGNNLKYGAVHQFGDKREVEARSATLYFKESGGLVGLKFAKKKDSNFAQDIEIGAHEIETPARAYLGVSTADEAMINETIEEHVDELLTESV